MEVPFSGCAGTAHYLEARSNAIKWTLECRARLPAPPSSPSDCSESHTVTR